MDLEYLKIYKSIIGCDEVGRGPIAGPVTAAAVKITGSGVVSKLKELNITDSKKLSMKKRFSILAELGIEISRIQLETSQRISYIDEEIEFCIWEIQPEEIDRINILQASLLAMKNASEKIGCKDSIVLIDGNKTFESTSIRECIVKGDSKVVAIGLASIIAKVFRDEKMKVFDTLYPGYNLTQNAGYPTKEHKNAVERELELAPSIVEALEASKNSYRGIDLERLRSAQIHTKGIPVLCSPSLLRNHRCGQVDLVIYKERTLYLYEIKGTPSLISKKQFTRLNQSASFLSGIFSSPIKLHVIN